MQVNLDDTTNINIEKVQDKDQYILSVDGRTSIVFSKSEMKFVLALVDSALKDDEGMSMDSLKESLKDAVAKHKTQLQLTLRNMKTEDIAYAIWFVGDQTLSADILANMSKRSAEDVQNTIKETVERRIRKERSEGNMDIEDVLKEQGRSAATTLLKKVLDSQL